jgi:hypothetical protein
MDGRNIQNPVFTEKTDPFCLEEMGTDCIHGHRIGSNDQSFIRPHVSPVEEMGSPSVKLGREATEDIQAGLSLNDRVIPNFAQG